MCAILPQMELDMKLLPLLRFTGEVEKLYLHYKFSFEETFQKSKCKEMGK